MTIRSSRFNTGRTTFTSFDVETTGLDFNDDEVLQIGLVFHEPGKAPQERKWLIRLAEDWDSNPAKRARYEEAQETHGIPFQQLRDEGVSPEQAWAEFDEYIARSEVVTAHNKNFDDAFAKKAGHEIRKPGLDSLAVSRRLLRGTEIFWEDENGQTGSFQWGGSHKLPNIYRDMFGEDLIGAHDALADSRGQVRAMQMLENVARAQNTSVSRYVTVPERPTTITPKQTRERVLARSLTLGISPAEASRYLDANPEMLTAPLNTQWRYLEKKFQPQGHGPLFWDKDGKRKFLSHSQWQQMSQSGREQIKSYTAPPVMRKGDKTIEWKAHHPLGQRNKVTGEQISPGYAPGTFSLPGGKMHLDIAKTFSAGPWLVNQQNQTVTYGASNPTKRAKQAMGAYEQMFFKNKDVVTTPVGEKRQKLKTVMLLGGALPEGQSLTDISVGPLTDYQILEYAIPLDMKPELAAVGTTWGSREEMKFFKQHSGIVGGDFDQYTLRHITVDRDEEIGANIVRVRLDRERNIERGFSEPFVSKSLSVGARIEKIFRDDGSGRTEGVQHITSGKARDVVNLAYQYYNSISAQKYEKLIGRGRTTKDDGNADWQADGENFTNIFLEKIIPDITHEYILADQVVSLEQFEREKKAGRISGNAEALMMNKSDPSEITHYKTDLSYMGLDLGELPIGASASGTYGARNPFIPWQTLDQFRRFAPDSYEAFMKQGEHAFKPYRDVIAATGATAGWGDFEEWKKDTGSVENIDMGKVWGDAQDLLKNRGISWGDASQSQISRSLIESLPNVGNLRFGDYYFANPKAVLSFAATADVDMEDRSAYAQGLVQVIQAAKAMQSSGGGLDPKNLDAALKKASEAQAKFAESPNLLRRMRGTHPRSMTFGVATASKSNRPEEIYLSTKDAALSEGIEVVEDLGLGLNVSDIIDPATGEVKISKSLQGQVPKERWDAFLKYQEFARQFESGERTIQRHLFRQPTKKAELAQLVATGRWTGLHPDEALRGVTAPIVSVEIAQALEGDLDKDDFGIAKAFGISDLDARIMRGMILDWSKTSNAQEDVKWQESLGYLPDEKSVIEWFQNPDRINTSTYKQIQEMFGDKVVINIQRGQSFNFQQELEMAAGGDKRVRAAAQELGSQMQQLSVDMTKWTEPMHNLIKLRGGNPYTGGYWDSSKSEPGKLKGRGHGAMLLELIDSAYGLTNPANGMAMTSRDVALLLTPELRDEKLLAQFQGRETSFITSAQIEKWIEEGDKGSLYHAIRKMEGGFGKYIVEAPLARATLARAEAKAVGKSDTVKAIHPDVLKWEERLSSVSRAKGWRPGGATPLEERWQGTVDIPGLNLSKDKGLFQSQSDVEKEIRYREGIIGHLKHVYNSPTATLGRRDLGLTTTQIAEQSCLDAYKAALGKLSLENPVMQSVDQVIASLIRSRPIDMPLHDVLLETTRKQEKKVPSYTTTPTKWKQRSSGGSNIPDTVGRQVAPTPRTAPPRNLLDPRMTDEERRINALFDADQAREDIRLSRLELSKRANLPMWKHEAIENARERMVIPEASFAEGNIPDTHLVAVNESELKMLNDKKGAGLLSADVNKVASALGVSSEKAIDLMAKERFTEQYSDAATVMQDWFRELGIAPKDQESWAQSQLAKIGRVSTGTPLSTSRKAALQWFMGRGQGSLAPPPPKPPAQKVNVTRQTVSSIEAAEKNMNITYFGQTGPGMTKIQDALRKLPEMLTDMGQDLPAGTTGVTPSQLVPFKQMMTQIDVLRQADTMEAPANLKDFYASIQPQLRTLLHGDTGLGLDDLETVSPTLSRMVGLQRKMESQKWDRDVAASREQFGDMRESFAQLAPGVTSFGDALTKSTEQITTSREALAKSYEADKPDWQRIGAQRQLAAAQFTLKGVSDINSFLAGGGDVKEAENMLVDVEAQAKEMGKAPTVGEAVGQGALKLLTGWAPMQIGRMWNMLGGQVLGQDIPAAAGAELSAWNMAKQMGYTSELPGGVAGGVMEYAAARKQAQVESGRAGYRAWGWAQTGETGKALAAAKGIAGVPVSAGLVSLIGLQALGSTPALAALATAAPWVAGAIAIGGTLIGASNYSGSVTRLGVAENQIAAYDRVSGIDGYWSSTHPGEERKSTLSPEEVDDARKTFLSSLGMVTSATWRGITQYEEGAELLREAGAIAPEQDAGVFSAGMALEMQESQEGQAYMQQAPSELSTRERMAGVKSVSKHLRAREGSAWGALEEGKPSEIMAMFQPYLKGFQAPMETWHEEGGVADKALRFAERGLTPERLGQITSAAGYSSSDIEAIGDSIDKFTKTKPQIEKAFSGAIKWAGLAAVFDINPKELGELAATTDMSGDTGRQADLLARGDKRTWSKFARATGGIGPGGWSAEQVDRLGMQTGTRSFMELTRGLGDVGITSSDWGGGGFTQAALSSETGGLVPLSDGTSAQIDVGGVWGLQDWGRQESRAYQDQQQRASRRQWRASGVYTMGQDITMMGGRDAGAAVHQMGQWDYQDAQRDQARAYQSQMYGIQGAQLALNRDRTEKQIEWSRADIDQGYNRSKASLEKSLASVGSRLAQQLTQIGWSEERQGINLARGAQGFAWQGEDIGRQMRRADTQYDWGVADIALQRATGALQFGWQQEDFAENIRFAGGRERKQLMKQQDRGVIMYGIEEGQRDEELDRLAEKRQWQDEDHRVALDRMDEKRDRMYEDYEIEMDHLGQRRVWAQESAGLEAEAAATKLEYIEADYKRDVERHEQRAAWSLEGLALNEASHAANMANWVKTQEIQDATQTAQRTYWEYQYEEQGAALGRAEAHLKVTREIEDNTIVATRGMQLFVQVFAEIFDPDGELFKVLNNMMAEMVMRGTEVATHLHNLPIGEN